MGRSGSRRPRQADGAAQGGARRIVEVDFEGKLDAGIRSSDGRLTRFVVPGVKVDTEPPQARFRIRGVRRRREVPWLSRGL